MPLQEVRAVDARELQDIADSVAKSHKILVVTGAGISTSCGIPDFRSKDGLYNMIPEQSLPTPPPSAPSTPSRKRSMSNIEQAETPTGKRRSVETDDEDMPASQSSTSSRSSRRSSNSPASRMKGQDLFHARVFQRADTTQVFNQFLAGFRQKLKEDVRETSKTHKFLRVLRDGGRLMRCYTQNIDGLEEREGLCVDLGRGKGNKRRFMKKHFESPRPEDIQNTDFDGGCEVVQLHGELNNLRCTVCSIEEAWTDEASEILLEGAAPKCNTCNDKSEQRQATGKRGLAVGTLRPNIVLYGEEHPQNTLLSPLVPYDIASGPEVLIIMGTSLKVFGMQKIIRDFAKAIHSKKHGRVIFVNRTRPAESVWEGIIDDFVEMDCDEWVEDLKERRPGLWLRQGELGLKETKVSNSKKKRKSDASDVDTEVPAKKAKGNGKSKANHLVSVDIPRKQLNARSKMLSPQTVLQDSTLEKTPRATKWKMQPPKDAYRSLLSPLARANRPEASPISKSPSSNINLGTPTHRKVFNSPTAPLFSPLTPSTPWSHNKFQAKTPSKLRVLQEMNDTAATNTANDKTPRSRSSNSPKTNLTNHDTSEHDENDESVLTSNLSRNLNQDLIAVQTDGTTDEEGLPLYQPSNQRRLFTSTKLFT